MVSFLFLSRTIMTLILLVMVSIVSLTITLSSCINRWNVCTWLNILFLMLLLIFFIVPWTITLWYYIIKLLLLFLYGLILASYERWPKIELFIFTRTINTFQMTTYSLMIFWADLLGTLTCMLVCFQSLETIDMTVDHSDIGLFSMHVGYFHFIHFLFPNAIILPGPPLSLRFLTNTLPTTSEDCNLALWSIFLFSISLLRLVLPAVIPRAFLILSFHFLIYFDGMFCSSVSLFYQGIYW